MYSIPGITRSLSLSLSHTHTHTHFSLSPSPPPLPLSLFPPPPLLPFPLPLPLLARTLKGWPMLFSVIGQCYSCTLTPSMKPLTIMHLFLLGRNFMSLDEHLWAWLEGVAWFIPCVEFFHSPSIRFRRCCRYTHRFQLILAAYLLHNA